MIPFTPHRRQRSAEEIESKRLQRREANRESAAKSRQKRIEDFKTQREQITLHVQVGEALVTETARLRAENEKLTAEALCVQELTEEVARLCAENARLCADNAWLRAENSRLYADKDTLFSTDELDN